MEITRTWASEHNNIALLDANSVPNEFTEMVHFLNASSIKYALSVNPTIYQSYIKQFWVTAKIKTHKGENYIAAMVDDQKVFVSESIIRDTLLFDDEDAPKVLVKADLFAGLQTLGYERKNNGLKFQKGLLCSHYKFLVHTLLHCLSSKTSGWNEFSAPIASAMVCLCNGNPFNFSNLILEGMLKSLREGGTYLLYPRFIQLIVENKIKKVRTHKAIYEAVPLVPKMFAFLIKDGKGFSGKVTPFLPYMVQLVQNNQGEGSENPTDSQHTPTFEDSNEVSSPQTEKTQTHRTTSKDTEHSQASVRMENQNETVLAEQDSDNINKTQSKATSSDKVSSEPESSDGNPSQMENIGGSGDQTRFDTELKSKDSPLREGHTSRSDEDRSVTKELMDDTVQNDNVHDSPLGPGNTGRSDETSMKQFNELMEKCTTLEKRCSSLEATVSTQTKQITKMQKQMKMLLSLKKSRSSTFKKFKKVGTSKHIGSSSLPTAKEVDASKQERNNLEKTGEDKILEEHAADGLDTGMRSGDDMEIDSGGDGENIANYVVADREGHEVVLEKIVETSESVVDKLKNLEPEQLVKATELMSGALKAFGDTLKDSAAPESAAPSVGNSAAPESAAPSVDNSAAHETTAAEIIADPAASVKGDSADAQGSAAGSSDKAAAEAMVMLNKKELAEQSSQQQQPSSQSQQQPPKPIQSPRPTSLSQPIHVSKLPTKGVSIREPSVPIKKAKSIASSSDKGKGKMEEKPEAYEAWEDELVKTEVDIEFCKLVKIEEQEVPTFDVKAWLNTVTAKKKKEVAAARKKKKILKGPTLLQQRRNQEKYLNKVKKWKMAVLRGKTDSEIFEMYQHARTECDRFIAMGSKEDEEIIAEMNRKLRGDKSTGEPEKIKEVENATKPKDAEQEENTANIKPVLSDENKKRGIVQKTFARKKREVDNAGGSGLNKGESTGDKADRQRVMTLTFLSPHKEPDLLNPTPLDVKHPIVSYIVGLRDYGSKKRIMWAVERTNGTWTHFLSFEHMMYHMDRSDVCDLWRLYKEKYGEVLPEEVHERIIYSRLKVMFEPFDGDLEWRALKSGKVHKWYFYQSCGVHSLTVGGTVIFMLAEKNYPVLNNHTSIIFQMLKPKMLHLQYEFDEQTYNLVTKYEKVLVDSGEVKE
ncbi:hypothetical protein CTI12_AA267660 [Artemisia annua]|uniref:Synaptobrevin, longin-like domain protein n=1 Tax=Artemisia annua TaxID=35608 RepID=A0A2U1NEN1_ARTAN|nr:hypothetical protein CTI12_AA267660 [Artemisia annua]